jgi:hypothetical protein
MRSITELIEKECILLILNTVTSLRCWWSVTVQTAIWYDFVIMFIVIVEINTFIVQQQLMNFVMLAPIIIVKVCCVFRKLLRPS